MRSEKDIGDVVVTSDESVGGPWLPGKYAIVAIGVLAVGLASAGVWYQYRLQHRPIEWWGVEAAELFLKAEEVEVWRLAEGAATDEKGSVMVDGREWRIVTRKDVRDARGFTHVRRALVMDGTFGWDEPVGDCQPVWRDALRFVEGEREAVVVLAFDCPRAALVGSGQVVSIRPVGEGLRRFFDEQFVEVEGE